MFKNALVYLAITILMVSGTAVKTALAEDQKPAAGTALPADGGEPGKAYAAYCKAMTSGDMKALKTLVSAERAKQMDDPDFAKMFEMIQAMMAKNIKVTGGTMSANEATLNAEGTDSMGGGKATGTISMVLEDKHWKVAKDSWTSGSK